MKRQRAIHLSPPDWTCGKYSTGGPGYRPGMVRFFPAPNGQKRRVEVEMYTYAGFSTGAHHWHVRIKPSANRVWDGERWREFSDDPELPRVVDEPFARIDRKDQAIRWARQILTKDFPSDDWEYVWPDYPEGCSPSILKDDPVEEEAVRGCTCCKAPRSMHTAAELAQCDDVVTQPREGPPRVLLQPTERRRLAELRASAARVLVDPGRGPISGTVGREIAVLADMNPAHVGLLATVLALIVERGGATSHLAQMAMEAGVAVVLLEDAVATYPEGARLTIDPSASPVVRPKVTRMKRRASA